MHTRVLLDSNGQDLAVETIQDVEPILDRNKIKRTIEQESDFCREIADIPNVILIRWFNEAHAQGNSELRMFSSEFDQIVKKKLQDPDWAYLRTDKPALIMGWMGFGS